MRRGLLLRVFLAIVAVALLSVGLAGLITRTELSGAFDAYLRRLPQPMGRGMGLGRHMILGAAEQTFLSTVDRGIVIGVLIAVTLAAIMAILVAYYLTRPLERLTGAAQALAGGDLTHRVDVGGPSEVERLGAAFNEMAESLEEAEGLRRRLVADVAHELRDPLAALQAQMEGVAEGMLPADEERIASLAEDVRHLSRLVIDLQDLAATEAGALSCAMGPVDLAAVVRREVARMSERGRPGVAVQSRCEEGLLVTGDEGRLSQVMRNLLGNALAHTERGSVVASCDREGDEVTVEVQDTGTGIPEKDLPYVFERFYRADEARARDTGGSGIGLAVSRGIIEAHGGEVFARNAEGGGAVVGFRLPLREEPHLGTS